MRKRVVHGSLIPLGMLMAGCVSAPGYRPPDVAVPASFTLAGGSETAAPAPDSCPPVQSDSQSGRPLLVISQAGPHGASAASIGSRLSDLLGDSVLTVLIQEAERANTDARIAESRLTSARAARRLQAYDLAPTITASGSSMRQQLSSAQVPGLASQLPAQQLWDVGFDASWELDLFGRVSRGVAARSAFVQAAEHGLDDVRVSIAAEVARSYFELRGTERQLAVSRRTAENQQRTVKLTEDLLAAGRGTAFDRERARAALYLTEATIPDLESRIAQRRLQLGVLLGRAPDALPLAPNDSGALPRLPDTLDVGTPAELVRRRPDVLAAERQLAARSMLAGAA
ncbi:MAG TPA: TolC family protein, partial [Gemmatimonadaceae bacterium]|nr:TolC family protein [Gemmatimonadaceae bacterium]